MLPSSAERPLHGAIDVDQSWRETFDFFDENHDGTISPAELQRCLKGLG